MNDGMMRAVSDVGDSDKRRPGVFSDVSVMPQRKSEWGRVDVV